METLTESVNLKGKYRLIGRGSAGSRPIYGLCQKKIRGMNFFCCFIGFKIIRRK